MLERELKCFVVLMVTFALCSSVASANETNESSKYAFDNYGGEVFTPEPMQFGENIRNQELNGYMETIVAQNNMTQRKHLLLQFYATPTEEQLELLAEYGVQRVDVAAPYTLIVSMPTNLTPADLPAESGLRWMGEIPIENKYDRAFGLNIPEWARMEDGQVEVWIKFFDDVSYEEAQLVANKYSTDTPQYPVYPYFFDSIIRTNESNIPLIASEDVVRGVGYPEGEVEDETAVDIEKSPGFQSVLSILALGLVLFYFRQRG